MEGINGKQEVKFVYEKSNNYFETFATSIYGGIAPNGMLEMYLLEESNNFPESETFVISQDNPIPVQTNVDIKPELKKIVKARVVIPMDSIPSIITWLQDKQEQFQRAKGQLEKQLKGGGK